MIPFGNRTPGESGDFYAVTHNIRGSVYTTPSGGPFPVDKITAYIWPATTASHVKCAIYEHATGNLVANSETEELTGIVGPGWRNFTFPVSRPILAGKTAYVLVAWADFGGLDNCYLYWIDGSASQGHYSGLVYAPAFPAHVEFGHGPENFSIYATLEGTLPAAARYRGRVI